MSRLEEINSVIQTYCDQLERKRCYIDKAEILALANLVEATANYKMAYRCMESGGERYAKSMHQQETVHG